VRRHAVIASNRLSHAAYTTALADIPGISVLAYSSAENNSHHYVVVEIDEAFPASRDEIIAALHAENILARKYFWPGCHGMKPYCDLFPHAGLMLANTERIANRVVVLPNGIKLSESSTETIADLCRVIGKATA
jgi:dTDP-4-amino-4,6-dideoxygalactose transaminase